MKATSVKKTVRWTVFSEEREGVYERADSMQGKAAEDGDPCYPHQKRSDSIELLLFYPIRRIGM